MQGIDLSEDEVMMAEDMGLADYIDDEDEDEDDEDN